MYRWIFSIFILSVIVVGTDFASAESTRHGVRSEAFEEADAALRKAPRALDAETQLTRVYSQWNDVGPEAVRAVLGRYVDEKRASAELRARARFLFAASDARLGEFDRAREGMAKMGFISRWATVGPFSNEGGSGYDTSYSPEDEPLQDPDVPLAGKGKKVRWRLLPEALYHLGMVHLEGLMTPCDNVCVYAKTVLIAERDGKALLQMGAGGAFQAFWNGETALVEPVYRGAGPDRNAARIAVRKGENTLLVKVCTEEVGDFGFYARVTDGAGEPYPLSPAEGLRKLTETTVASVARPVAVKKPSARLLERAAARPDDGAAQSAAARYLYFSDSRNLHTHTGRDTARAACEKGKTVDDCLIWAVWALDRNEERLALERARAVSGDSDESLLAAARWEMEGPEPARALEILDKIALPQEVEVPDGTAPSSASPVDDTATVSTTHLRAAMLKMEITAATGFARTAFRQAAVLARRFPNIPTAVDFLKVSADRSGSMKTSIEALKRGLRFNFDEVERHTELAESAGARGDWAILDRHLNDMLSAAPYSDDTYVKAARLLEGAGQTERTSALLRQRLEMDPENGAAWADLGLFLMRENAPEEAAEALTAALRLRPQDARLAEYLEHLGPKEPLESAYLVPDTLFAGLDAGAEPGISRYLVDQTVVEVYASGLSSRFRQTVFRIGNRADAKAWRVRDIQYLPETQQLKVLAAKVYRADGSVDKIINRGSIPVSEPWYRLYYDVAAEVLEFPSLSPGDTVEISYRLDDVSRRNMFNDYFGDFSFIQGTEPKSFWRYAVIAPDSRTLQFNRPAYSVDQTVEEADGKRTHTFEARNVPAVHQENDMPGMAEIAAYLHVSTYASWQDMARWYQGLIRHQMEADSRIRTKTAELIRGKKSDIEKVRAVYDWVVTATRYVGLEFGIHGYKPYRAPLVVSRGFGDCKDKASLLVTMLREAGVAANFVLIRTSDQGVLSPEPASLAVFNHAIAYVPSLGLYLDGTAENHGVYELPFGDQGAFALILKEDGAELVTTPVTAPERNAAMFESEIELAVSGDAVMRAEASIRGREAAALRRGLEAEATRKDRFEASLAAVYPGALLASLDVGTLSDLSASVAYTFTARIPTYGTVHEDGMELPLDDGLGLTADYARLPSRSYDLIIGPTRVMARKTALVLPPGYEPVSLPESTEITSPFGRLSLQVRRVENRVEITRRFELSVARVSPDVYPDFAAFARRVDETLSARLVLRRSK